MKTALTALPLVACSFALVLGACSGGIDDPHEDEHGSSQAPMITTGIATISPTVIPQLPPLPCITVKRGSASGDVADAWLAPGAYAGMNFGTAERLSITGLSGSLFNNKTLIRFDIAANAIPKGASITFAEVVFTPIEPNPTGQLAVYTVNADWQESTVTFNSFPKTGAYSLPAIRTVPFSGLDKVRFDVTQQVIDWVDGTVPNHGLVLGPAGSAADMLDYHFGAGSSESERAPYLRVCWDASPCAGKADGTACSDTGTCTSAGTCQAGVCKNGSPAAAGTVCRKAANACDTPEVCDGTKTECPDAKIATAGTVCRPVAGGCDTQEICDGAAMECPTDTFKSAGTTCRTAAGPCDQPEACSGTAAACPADVKKPAGTGCADDGNPCSQDVCDGANDACQHPAGNAGAVCRGASGSCDVAEKCDGTSTACPADKVAAAGTECRGSAGPCDQAEACNGSAKTCPSDVFKPATTVCRQSIGTCDITDYCTGGAASCPSDKAQPAGTSCGNSMVCQGTSCIACGTVGGPCCNGSCGGSNTYCGDDDKCYHCGNQNELCCNFQTCPGSTNANPLTCTNPGGALARCTACGGLGEVCCFGTYGCESNYECSNQGGGLKCHEPKTYPLSRHRVIALARNRAIALAR